MSEVSEYTIDVFWSVEDEAWIAVLPDIPSLSAWGESRESAVMELRIALQAAAEAAAEEGSSLPAPREHHFERVSV